MEVTTLNLWGRPFVDCVTIESNFRGKGEAPNEACFSYVHSGKQDVYAPSGKITAKDGEGILMNCGNWVTGIQDATPISNFKAVVFHVNLNAVKRAFDGKDIGFLSSYKESKLANPTLKYGHSELIDSYVESLTPYFDHPDIAKDEVLALKLQELIYIICDFGNNALASQIIGTLQTQGHLAFESIISANLYSGLSIDELAHLTTRSESAFKRDFRKWYKESPAKYIKRKRLEKSSVLLKNTQLQVNEIAWECGFETAAHFGASFRSFYGKTPKEFRG